MHCGWHTWSNEGEYRSDIRKYKFPQTGTNDWNKLSADCVNSNNVNMVKKNWLMMSSGTYCFGQYLLKSFICNFFVVAVAAVWAVNLSCRISRPRSLCVSPPRSWASRAGTVASAARPSVSATRCDSCTLTWRTKRRGLCDIHIMQLYECDSTESVQEYWKRLAAPH